MLRYIGVVYTVLLVAVSSSAKQYRSDYQYDRKTDAFYKLHTDAALYHRAQTLCEVEGAKLMAPTQRDVAQTHGMLKQFPDIGDRVWVGDDARMHESGEEIDSDEDLLIKMIKGSHSPCEVVTRDGEVEKLDCLYNNMYPFICKVDAKYAPYDAQCKVFSNGYQYVENVGSCYKVSSEALSWDEAYDECRTEGAHLVVLNSELEHQMVHNLTHYAPKISSRAHTPWYWYAGIRAEKTTDGSPVVYKTIFGQTLREAGYDEWADGEPNNFQDSELCGSIFINDGKYNDLTCSHLFAFICEKEVNNNK